MTYMGKFDRVAHMNAAKDAKPATGGTQYHIKAKAAPVARKGTSDRFCADVWTGWQAAKLSALAAFRDACEAVTPSPVLVAPGESADTWEILL